MSVNSLIVQLQKTLPKFYPQSACDEWMWDIACDFHGLIILIFFLAFSFSQCHWKLPKATKDAPLRYLFHPKFENWKIQWMKCFGQNMCEVSFRTNVQKIFLKTRRKRPWVIVRVYLIFSIALIRTSLKWLLI